MKKMLFLSGLVAVLSSHPALAGTPITTVGDVCVLYSAGQNQLTCNGAQINIFPGNNLNILLFSDLSQTLTLLEVNANLKTINCTGGNSRVAYCVMRQD